MFQVFNNLEQKFIFEGNESQLIDFTQLIVKDNQDENISILGLSDAVEYIEEYCDNLDLITY